MAVAAPARRSRALPAPAPSRTTAPKRKAQKADGPTIVDTSGEMAAQKAAKSSRVGRSHTTGRWM